MGKKDSDKHTVPYRCSTRQGNSYGGLGGPERISKHCRKPHIGDAFYSIWARAMYPANLAILSKANEDS